MLRRLSTSHESISPEHRLECVQPLISCRIGHSRDPMGDGLLVAGLFFTDYPPSWEKIPLLRTWGYVILWEHFGFPPVLRKWVTKGLGMSSLVYATGNIKDPVPLIAKRRGLSPGGRFPPSFIHQVIIITRLNKLYNCMFSP